MGHDVKLEMTLAVDGRKRFQGAMTGIQGDNLLIACETGVASLPLVSIKSAKLILTDRLIAAVEEENAAAAAFVGGADAPPVHA